MGMFDGILGGVVGAAMVNVIGKVIEKHGGVQGVVSEFEQKGLGGTVRSWVGTGANEPISGDQVHHVLGSTTVQELAQHAGVSVEEMTAKLSELLPKAIDSLTPHGTVQKA